MRVIWALFLCLVALFAGGCSIMLAPSLIKEGLFTYPTILKPFSLMILLGWIAGFGVAGFAVYTAIKSLKD